MVFADDGRGSAVEITPRGTVLIPREGLFQLVEMWIENCFMLEVMTPEQTERYVEITRAEFFASMLGITFPQNAPRAESLNLIA